MKSSMTIREFIGNQVFLRRAQEHGVLVIYDAARRYREIALAAASDRCRVIDASLSVIEKREEATEALEALAEGSIDQLILWVPALCPLDSEAKQRDPFSVFGEIGSVFPKNDGDDYASLCRKAKPDHIPEINRLFEEGEPSFEMVDALDQGSSWPKLKTLLNTESTKEILIGIIAPKPHQEAALKNEPTWAGEAKDFVQRILGHRLKTKGQTRASIAEELWRLILFSEFVFDSGGGVPASLETIPRSGNEAKTVIYDLCDELRKHADYAEVYRSAALKVEEDLALAEQCSGMVYLGVRDTFSFEERFYLQRMVDRVLDGRIDLAREIADSRKQSIWRNHEGRLAEWSLAGRALDLLEAAQRLSGPKFSTLEAIIHGYAMTWRDLDRYHREMEQAVIQWQGDHDGLEDLISRARADYFKSVEALQAEFVRLVAAEGWPGSGGQLISNREIFSRMVAPGLEAGKRVAYFLVDALRYELGVELEKQLSDKLQVKLHTVCAQLPTYTEVGMASLMPNAELAFKLMQKDGTLVTTLDGNVAKTPTERFAYLKSKKGDQCLDIELETLLQQKKLKIPDKVRLLVIRTRSIDSIGHDNPSQALLVIPELIRQVLRGLNKASELGFDVAVVATDHGFILFHEQGAGDVAPKPSGNWLVETYRCVLGYGTGDAASLVMESGELGIPGDFKDYGAPKSLVPYSRGQTYYHEGLSLQECVLPCLAVMLGKAGVKQKKPEPPKLTLTYRQGKSDRITSRRPVVDLTWPQGGLFVDEREIDVALDAVNSKGEMVGQVGSGQTVNSATGTVRVKPGSALAIGLRMDDDFSGSFTVRVLDPTTNMLLTSLNLKTGYLE